MRGRCIQLCVGCVILVLAGSTPALAATTAEVNASIKRGVGWLYGKQDAVGSFELVPVPVTPPPVNDFVARAHVEAGQWGGYTGLSVYTLLSCGETFKKNARLSRGGDWLKEHQMGGTYACSLRGSSWPLMGDDSGVRAAAMADCKTLVNALKLQGDPRGLTGYFTNTNIPGDDINNNSWGDHSSSLYDVLAVHALDGMGFEVPDKYWELVNQRWRADQLADGAWKYKNIGPGMEQSEEMNMTASGVAVLFICQQHLLRDMGCTGYQDDKAIEAGLTWIDQHYDQAMQVFGAAEVPLANYGMYAVERAGLLSGRKYFAGTRNWYKDGCAMIIKAQQGDGSWNNLPDTCFALLFLCHGRAPLVMNKLQYDGAWNERPRDAANVATYMTHGLEREIMWQIVTLKVPVEELHESPILYIAGTGPLNFTPADIDKLKQFVEEGGTLLGNADCGDQTFAKFFKELGLKIWPDFEWEKLTAAHTIFADEQYKAEKWSEKPDLLGLSNGVRELMLLAPGSDPSHAWQTNSPRMHEHPFQTIADIFAYTVDRDQEWLRDDTYVVPGPGNSPGGIHLARIKYGGYWNPEPGGWRQLNNILAAKGQGGINAEIVELGQGQLAGYRLAHMTGVGKFKFNDKQKAEIKAFVSGGGTLIMDAAGGTKGFTAAAKELLAELFPDGKLSVLPKGSGAYAGLETVGLRRAAKKDLGAANAEVDPQLLGLEIGGRTAVYLSPLDLTEGLVGQPVDGVIGYTPQSAAIIMSNLISGAR